MKKILLVYFSFTGNTEKVGNLITRYFKQEGVNCDVYKIEPSFNLPYFLWFILSFIPSLPFPLKDLNSLNLDNYDVIILGTPKWTFNCPPVTSFISFLKKARGKIKAKFAIFLTYGGFKENIYLEKLKMKLEKFGFNVVVTEKFKRSDIRSDSVSIDLFCSKILNSLDPSNPYVSQS